MLKNEDINEIRFLDGPRVKTWAELTFLLPLLIFGYVIKRSVSRQFHL